MHRTFLVILMGVTCPLLACEERADPPGDQEPVNPARLVDVPMRTDAADMLGKRLDVQQLDWLDTQDAPRKDARVMMVRWWTDTCPACAMSLPAIEQLRAQFADQGLETLAVYHPKPPREVPAEDILQRARALGYRGPVAADLQWKKLREVYLDIAARHSTSVSFLLDSDGVIRYVHPGPAFGPSDDPARRQHDEDYRNLAAAIRAMLQEP